MYMYAIEGLKCKSQDIVILINLNSIQLGINLAQSRALQHSWYIYQTKWKLENKLWNAVN